MRFKSNRFSRKRLRIVSNNKINLNGHSTHRKYQVWNNANCSTYKQADLQVTNGTHSANLTCSIARVQESQTRKIWSAVRIQCMFYFSAHCFFEKDLRHGKYFAMCVSVVRCKACRLEALVSNKGNVKWGDPLRNIRTMFLSLWHAERYTGTAKQKYLANSCNCSLPTSQQDPTWKKEICLPLIRKSVSVLADRKSVV